MSRPADRLFHAVERFENLTTLEPGPHLLHLIIAAMHGLCYELALCEDAGLTRDVLLEAVNPARAICAASPFLHRIQQWPRGYQGDFETIEYLYRAENRAIPGTLSYWCEQYALTCAAAQQHRNKLQRQAQLITRAVVAAPHGGRILSFASGSALDAVAVVPLLESSQTEVWLNDLDGEALATARIHLSALGGRLHTLEANALKLIRRTSSLGRFDLVLAGGLFDYFSDRQIVFFLSQAFHRLLRPGGTLFFTNIAQPNPYRVLMEYLADWYLIERSEARIRWLAAEAAIPAESLDITRDSTGLSLLVQISKPG